MVFLKQFQTVDDVPKKYFKENKIIYAFCERVIDGDTVRVRHIPLGKIRATPKPLSKRALSDCTLSIRIYGVDTPETAKNKNQQSQAFGDEATDFTSNRTLHKMLRITFLRKDQYHRAVCVVETVNNWCQCWPWSPPRDLSVALAQQGLAELYTGGGAEYNNNRELLERKIERAQRRKMGIWSLGESRVSAAEHKRNGGGKAKQKNSKYNSIPAVATSSSSHSSTRGGGQKASSSKKKQGKKQQSADTNNKAKKQNRGESVLETVVTGLEFVA